MKLVKARRVVTRSGHVRVWTKCVGIVIDPYRRSVTECLITQSDALFAISSFSGGVIEPLRLRKHDGLYANEDALRAMSGPGASLAGFRFSHRTFFGYGLIVARQVNVKPRPQITVEEVARQTEWLEQPLIHTAPVKLRPRLHAANQQGWPQAKEAA